MSPRGKVVPLPLVHHRGPSWLAPAPVSSMWERIAEARGSSRRRLFVRR